MKTKKRTPQSQKHTSSTKIASILLECLRVALLDSSAVSFLALDNPSSSRSCNRHSPWLPQNLTFENDSESFDSQGISSSQNHNNSNNNSNQAQYSNSKSMSGGEGIDINQFNFLPLLSKLAQYTIRANSSQLYCPKWKRDMAWRIKAEMQKRRYFHLKRLRTNNNHDDHDELTSIKKEWLDMLKRALHSTAKAVCD
jgi:hypothetical protein